MLKMQGNEIIILKIYNFLRKYFKSQETARKCNKMQESVIKCKKVQ